MHFILQYIQASIILINFKPNYMLCENEILITRLQ